MPYSNRAAFPPALAGFDPPLTVAQANEIAKVADTLENDPKVDNAWAIAISQFKKGHVVEGNRWVEKKEQYEMANSEAQEQGTVRCECLDCGHILETEEHCADITCPECGGQMRREDRPGPGRLGEEATEEEIALATDEDRERQKARSRKFGIGVKAGGHITKPAQYSGVADDDFLDPVNYRYPVDRAHLTPALSYFNQQKNRAAGGYNPEEWAKMGRKLARRLGTDYYYDGETHTVTRRSNVEAEGDLRWFGAIVLGEDGGLPEWMAIHEVGRWNHPTYGEFAMTLEQMYKAEANFHDCVHRPRSPVDAQVPIDTRHAGNAACGWLDDMKVRAPYLLGKPNWTKFGAEIVLDKQYRYVSPVYVDDPDRGPIFKEITLTNRDFLKMPPIGAPIMLSNDLTPNILYPEPRGNDNTGGISMTKATDKNPDAEVKKKTPSPEETQETPQVIQLSSEEFEQLKTLAEAKKAADDRAKVLEKRLEKTEKRLDEAEEQGRIAEVNRLAEKAGERGVDAFTLNWAKTIMLALPRSGESATEITLEVGEGDAKAEKKLPLYKAMAYFLANVPPAVPVGERTLSEDTSTEETEDKEIKALSDRLADHMNLEADGEEA